MSLLVLGVIAWLSVPPLLRSNIEKHGSEFLGREVKVGKVEFKPWSLELALHDVSVASADGASRQIEVARIYIDAAFQSLVRLAPVIDAIEVDAPMVRVAHLAPGEFDFDDVLQRLAARPKTEEKPDAEPPRFALYNIVLRDGAMEFDDRTVERKQELRKLDLSIPFLTNLRKTDREVKVTPHLAFELNGSPFESTAQATPFADSHRADVNFSFKDFDLAPFSAYIPASVPVRLQSGLLDADLQISFEQKQDAPQVGLGGTVVLRGVKVSDTTDQELAGFDRLDVALADVQPLQGVVHVKSVQWQAPRVALRRGKEGRLEIPGLASSGAPADKEAPTADKAASSPSGTQWKVQLDALGVRDGAVDWQDKAVAGEMAHLRLQHLDLAASEITWPMQQPVPFNGKTELVRGAEGKTAATLGFEGRSDLQQAKLAASLRGLPLEWAAPYLSGVIVPRLDGQLDLDVGVARNGDLLMVQVGQGTLKDVSLTCTGKGDRCRTLVSAGMAGAKRNTVLELGELALNDTLVDLFNQKVTLGKLVLHQPKLYVERARDGRLMYEDWLVAAPGVKEPSGKPAGGSAQDKPWSIALGALDLKDGAVVVRDAAQASAEDDAADTVSGAGRVSANGRVLLLRVNALQAQLRDVAFPPPKNHAFTAQLSARVAGPGRAEPGSLRYEGRVGLEPLAITGKVQAHALPLHVAQPYLPKDLNARIVRADGGFQGDVNVLMGEKGPTATVKGDVALDDVRVRAADSGLGTPKGLTAGAGAQDDLLNWKALALKGVSVAVTPDKPLSLEVQETTLSDFFARVIVQENGRVNLQDLQGQPVEKADTAADGAAAAAPQPASPAASAVAATPAPDPMAPIIRFGPVNVVRGAMYFTDHFVKPNYSTDLTELNGRLSAFSSVRPAGADSYDMADLELRGKAEGTAIVEVTGKLNPLAKPLALDIQGRMRDLELPPLSPYSVKYAGHGIERGKMSMDVAYKIDPSGQLTASNKVVLNQLAFGDQVEGAPASLPVRLAVALLADRNGVIDVDLPISGSINDPQFSLGGVILKVIGNLIVKAVTAPFSLLASAFGGGDEQGAVPFEAGSAVLAKAAQDNLDKVAQALIDRPALKMTVVGWADAGAEEDGLKRERLQAMVLGQKRRKVTRDGGDTAEVNSVDPSEYSALLKDTYKRADIKKPRNVVGLAKDLPDAEMEALLLANIHLADNAAQELALARGVAVRDYLASRKVPMDRLFVGAGKLHTGSADDSKWAPKAELTLAAR